ncbi:hypothetical protein M0802_005505 [Mischocyttarus mexicanus]|nr:hypothetical protein M0802_005505 [Mischocyttarus mexicanus]
MGANYRATESKYRVSEVKVGGAVRLRKTPGVEHGVSACFAVWDQDPKLRLDVHRHKNSRGQGGQQRGPVFSSRAPCHAICCSYVMIVLTALCKSTGPICEKPRTMAKSTEELEDVVEEEVKQEQQQQQQQQQHEQCSSSKAVPPPPR